MIRGHVIELNPNNKQATYFAKACGIARFAYNWALAEWQRQYAQDKAYRDAYKRFFKGESGYPQFRKKGVNDRFSLSNDQFAVKNKQIRIPNLGWVRMREALRFNGKILSAKIFSKGGRWFATIAVEIADIVKLTKKTGKQTGIDLGIIDLATLSDGTKIKAPKPLKSKLKKLQRLSRQLSRKQKGSNNRAKAKAKLSRLHLQISNIRKDTLHKLTTRLVSEYDVIAIENLNTKGMMQNRKLSRAIGNLGFYEFKRQLIYKTSQVGKVVKELDRWFPSSRTCSGCGHLLTKDKLPLSVRQWQCASCKQINDRDVNASINILHHADKVLTHH